MPSVPVRPHRRPIRLACWLLPWLFAAGCTERVSGTSLGADPSAPSCGELAAVLVDHCADAFAGLLSCVESVGVQGCDRENLAHAHCTGDAAKGHEKDELDLAFSRYLCELSPEPGADCDERIAACAD